MAFQDRELACRDCGGAFIFTAGEQEFYASKGLQHDPVRCPGCRQNRKAMRPEDRDDAPSYGIYASWGGRTPRQIHPATCSGCAQVAEVPFLARGDRPVFCSDCYKQEQERQQAAEEAAAVALAGMSGGTAATRELEGDGPAAEAAAAATEEAPAEAETDAPAAATAVEAIAADEPAGATDDAPAADAEEAEADNAATATDEPTGTDEAADDAAEQPAEVEAPTA